MIQIELTFLAAGAETGAGAGFLTGLFLTASALAHKSDIIESMSSSSSGSCLVTLTSFNLV